MPGLWSMGLVCENPKVPFCYMGHKSCNSRCKDKIVYKPKICTPQTWQLFLSTSNQLSRKKKSNLKELRGHQRTTQLIKKYIHSRWAVKVRPPHVLRLQWWLIIEDRNDSNKVNHHSLACFLKKRREKSLACFGMTFFPPWLDKIYKFEQLFCL